MIEQGPDGESAVTFSSNDATALEDQRDEEELRRLLYVASTRARDRLYLAAQIDERGLVRKGARSLAGLLPPALMALFAQAAATPAPDRVDWDSPNGRFTFNVCRPGPLPTAIESSGPNSDAPLDVTWLTSGRPAPVAATEHVVDIETKPAPTPKVGRTKERSADLDPAADRLIGQLVHRLFQYGADARLGPDTLTMRAESLIRIEERVDFGDTRAIAKAAATLFSRLYSRADVREALALGEVHYEVPFSFAPAGLSDTIVRGVIDCLIVPPAGPPVVLEFKTGVERPEHARQVERYAAAVRAFFGLDRVEMKILYA